MSCEIWRPIPELEGYEASDCGNIRSVARIVTRPMPYGLVQQPRKGCVLSPVACANGYLYVSIRRRSYQVHRLVARAWVDGFSPELDAAHKDNDRHNNVPSNLVWKTRKENIDDQIVHGTRLRGERQNGAKLNVSQVQKMRALRLQGVSWRKLGEQFGVAPMTAKNAVLGKTWGHVEQAIFEK